MNFFKSALLLTLLFSLANCAVKRSPKVSEKPAFDVTLLEGMWKLVEKNETLDPSQAIKANALSIIEIGNTKHMELLIFRGGQLITLSTFNTKPFTITDFDVSGHTIRPNNKTAESLEVISIEEDRLELLHDSKIYQHVQTTSSQDILNLFVQTSDASPRGNTCIGNNAVKMAEFDFFMDNYDNELISSLPEFKSFGIQALGSAGGVPKTVVMGRFQDMFAIYEYYTDQNCGIGPVSYGQGECSIYRTGLWNSPQSPFPYPGSTPEMVDFCKNPIVR